MQLWTDETDHQRIAMVGPLGCGKSYGLAIKMFLLARANQGYDGMLVVPTYGLFSMVHREEWPTIWGSLGVNVEFGGSDAFTWPWGSKLWVRSAEAPKRLAGPNLAYVGFDEPGQMVREAWERGSVRARHPRAPVRQVVLGGTPEGLNWFADEFANPTGNNTTIFADCWHRDMSHYQQTLEQTYGYDPSLLDAYGRGMFVPLRAGRCWQHFSRAAHVRPVEYQPNLELVLGCDFNIDTMRWVVVQRSPHEIRYLDEISLGRSGTTAQAAKEFVRRYAHHKGLLVVCGDASGGARSTSGPTDYQIIREELGAGGFTNVAYQIPKANPLQKDRVDNTNYHFSGRGKAVLVSAKCKELMLDWERVAWKKGQPSIDKNADLTRGHAADASDYILWMLERVRSIGDRSSATVHVANYDGGVATMEF